MIVALLHENLVYIIGVYINDTIATYYDWMESFDALDHSIIGAIQFPVPPLAEDRKFPFGTFK